MKRKLAPDNLPKSFDFLGWYGAAAILAAYALVSFDLISPQGWLYQLLNFTGALGVLVISYAKQARQPALLNLVWAVIAFVALVGLALKAIYS